MCMNYYFGHPGDILNEHKTKNKAQRKLNYTNTPRKWRLLASNVLQLNVAWRFLLNDKWR